MHDNSMDAYREERARLSRRATRIFDLYCARKKPLSDLAVRDALGFSDMNSVRPRIIEMIQSGLLHETGETILNWKETTIARILLMIARMLCEDDKLREDLRNISNHIQCRGPL